MITYLFSKKSPMQTQLNCSISFISRLFMDFIGKIYFST